MLDRDSPSPQEWKRALAGSSLPTSLPHKAHEHVVGKLAFHRQEVARACKYKSCCDSRCGPRIGP